MEAADSKPNNQVSSAFDLPGKSLRIVKENWQAFAVVNVLGLISAFLAIFDTGNKETTASQDAAGLFEGSPFAGQELAAVIGAGLLVGLIFFLVSIFLYAMSVDLQVRAAKGEKPSISTIFEAGKKHWLRLLGLTLVSGVIILVGLILLIIPGIFAFGRIVFAPYLLVEKNMGIIEALKASNEMAKGRAGLVWGAILVYIALVLAAGIFGIIPLIGSLISTILAIGFTMIIPLRYTELKRLSKAEAK